MCVHRVAEETICCQASTSIVVGHARSHSDPPAHIVNSHDDVYRRINDDSVMFAPKESGSISKLGLFKTSKGNSELFSPVQDKNTGPNSFNYHFPVPETGNVEYENGLSVYETAMNPSPHLDPDPSSFNYPVQVTEAEDVEYENSLSMYQTAVKHSSRKESSWSRFEEMDEVRPILFPLAVDLY